MQTKYIIEYTRLHHPTETPLLHRTDDPIEAEEFLMQLLSAHARILQIKHEGIEMPQHQMDRMLKVASERLVSQMLRDALSIDGEEVRHRFGIAA
jgi:hypothetical protein